jgi:hypothetical protein
MGPLPWAKVVDDCFRVVGLSAGVVTGIDVGFYTAKTSHRVYKGRNCSSHAFCRQMGPLPWAKVTDRDV